MLSSILSILSSISGILRIPVTCLLSFREELGQRVILNWAQLLPNSLCFSEAPPIFEVALIAKPAGAKSSNTSCGHSPSGGGSAFCGHCRLAGVPTYLHLQGLGSLEWVWAHATNNLLISAIQGLDSVFFFFSAPMSQNGSHCNRDHKCLCNCWFSWW